MRLPKIVDRADEGRGPEDLEARVLERLALFELLSDLVLDLFRLFIGIRISRDWPRELLQIRAWIQESSQRLAQP